MSSSRSPPTSPLRSAHATSSHAPPPPTFGHLPTPQDQATQAVSSRLGELGSRLSALSGFGRGQPSDPAAAAAPGSREAGDAHAGEGVKREGTEEKEEADYSPYTGEPLRRLIPLQASLPPLPIPGHPSSGPTSPVSGPSSAAGPGAAAGETSLSQQLWTHLAQVRKLQAELARMHLEMEDVTGRDRSAASAAPSAGAGASGRGNAAAAAGGGGGGNVGAGGGEVDLSALEAEQNLGEREKQEEERERGREVWRREQVGGIMSKLDDLSQSLTAYHSVVTPSLDLSPSPGRTRGNTMTGLSHGTPSHADGTFSDTALSSLGGSLPRIVRTEASSPAPGEGGNALGIRPGGAGSAEGGDGRQRNSRREGSVLREEVVDSPVGGHVRGFEF